MVASRYEAEIGNRFRNIRESQNLSRKDVEERTNGEVKESILAILNIRVVLKKGN